MSDLLQYEKVDGEYPTKIIVDGKYLISLEYQESKPYIKVATIPITEQARFKKLPKWLQEHIIEFGGELGNCPSICPYETVCSGRCYYL